MVRTFIIQIVTVMVIAGNTWHKEVISAMEMIRCDQDDNYDIYYNGVYFCLSVCLSRKIITFRIAPLSPNQPPAAKARFSGVFKVVLWFLMFLVGFHSLLR